MPAIPIGMGGPATIPLPDATTAPWWEASVSKSKTLTLMHAPPSTGTCTVNTYSGQKIYTTVAGVTTLTIGVGETLVLRSNGQGWQIVGFWDIGTPGISSSE